MRAKNNHTWVIVANGSECKIFSTQSMEKRLELLKGFYSAEARVHSVDLGMDRPGRVHESINATRHAIEPKINQQRKEKAKFSHLIADYLNKAVNIKGLKHLILVASPEFLGSIRKYLSKHTVSIISKEINKDLVDAKEEDILNHIL
jgi:protein required for attachment to host cells